MFVFVCVFGCLHIREACDRLFNWYDSMEGSV